MNLQELYSKDGSWTQFMLARDKDGERVSSIDESAVSWCLMGAIDKCYTEEIVDVYIKLRNRIGSVVTYNNTTGRTIEDIRVLVKELDI